MAGARKLVVGSTVNRLAIRAIFWLILIMGVSGVLLVTLEFQEERQKGIDQARAVSEIVADKLAGTLRMYSQVIERQVAGNPRIGSVLSEEAWPEIKKYEAWLTRLLPDALQVRILPREWDKLDPGSNPPVSFATLEMLRGVERTGRPSVAEVHQFGRIHPHVALAVPVRSGAGGDVVGVVQLALPMHLLERSIASGIGGGRIELQQVVQGESVVLFASGPSPFGAGDGELPVRGTLWQVVYWGKRGGLNPMAYWDTWGILALGTLVSVLVIWLLFRSLRLKFRRDLSALASLAKGLAQAEGPITPPQAAIQELQGFMEFLAHSGRARGKKASLDIPTSESEAKSDTAAPTTPTQGSLPDQDSPSGSSSVSATLFRAYDIRGVVGDTLDTDIVYLLGRAIGSEAQACGEQTVIIARDGRHSSELLSEALSRGLVESGREVVDLGLVPTPVVYFATHFLGSNSGVMVTGSHNPPEYNGLKIVIGGEALAEGRIKDLHRRIQEGDLVSGTGARREQDLLPDYISRISEDVQLLTPMKVVVDCGNGVSSVVAPALLRVLGCDVVELFCHVDGNFPNHHPDPGDPRNLQALIDCVRNEGADLGIALDGDGDRLGIVDSQGNIIWPDRLLMLLARDVLLRQPGADVIYDVKSSRHLASEILTYGGRPIMWKSGHSLIKEKMRETGAVLAGGLTGHIYFQERWYGFDDGLYAAARLLEVLSGEGVSSAEVFAQLPESVSTAELHAPVGEGRGPSLVGALLERGQFPDAKLVTIDGIRAEFQDGWGLVRPSNTGPNLVFRFEADDKVALTRIQGIFRDQLSVIDTTLELPF